MNDTNYLFWLFAQNRTGEGMRYSSCDCSRISSVGRDNDRKAWRAWSYNGSRKEIVCERRFVNQPAVMIGTSENRKTFTAPTKATCDEPWVKRHAENRVDLVVESQTGIDLPCFVTSERQEKIHHYKVRVQVLVYCLAELPDVCAGVQFYDAVSRLFTKGTHPEQAAKLKNLATAMHPYMGEIVPVETERECIPGVLMLHKLEADAAWAGDLHLIRPAAEPLNGQTLRRFASASFNGQSWEFSAEIATIRESSGPEGAL